MNHLNACGLEPKHLHCLSRALVIGAISLASHGSALGQVTVTAVETRTFVYEWALSISPSVPYSSYTKTSDGSLSRTVTSGGASATTSSNAVVGAGGLEVSVSAMEAFSPPNSYAFAEATARAYATVRSVFQGTLLFIGGIESTDPSTAGEIYLNDNLLSADAYGRILGSGAVDQFNGALRFFGNAAALGNIDGNTPVSGSASASVYWRLEELPGITPIEPLPFVPGTQSTGGAALTSYSVSVPVFDSSVDAIDFATHVPVYLSGFALHNGEPVLPAAAFDYQYTSGDDQMTSFIIPEDAIHGDTFTVDFANQSYNAYVGQPFDFEAISSDEVTSFTLRGIRPLVPSWPGLPAPFSVGFTFAEPGMAVITTSSAPATPGDYDGDNYVDGDDFLLWKQQFGSTVKAFAGADGNGDGVIDAADYTLWRDNFGATNAAFSGAAVPEPSSVTLLLAAVATILGKARPRLAS